MDYNKIIDYIVRANGEKITSGQIRDHFKIKESMTGNFNTRMEIKQAVEFCATVRGIPIGADGGGYFLITDYQQLERYKNNLKNRIKGIQNRIDSVQIAWDNR